jgi:co-chaperonin GroES (HSP10)
MEPTSAPPIGDEIVHLLPEVDNIMNVQVTGQNILVKPFEITLAKTNSGIILDTGGAKTEFIKNTVLQKGAVISKGSKVSEDLKVGTTVFFFKASASGKFIRQGTDVYVILGEYDIPSFLKK